MEFCLIIIQVIFLEGILSIDNAAVLGAMVSVLPKKEMVPWPGPLKFLGPPIHRLLGGQQSAALKVGLLGAYIGRGLMLVLANFGIHNDWLKRDVHVNELLDWALVPFAWLFKTVFKASFFILRPAVSFFFPAATQTAEVEADPGSTESME